MRDQQSAVSSSEPPAEENGFLALNAASPGGTAMQMTATDIACLKGGVLCPACWRRDTKFREMPLDCARYALIYIA